MAPAAPVLLLVLSLAAEATEGYHKDLFMDSAYELTSREQLYAAEMLGLSYDALVTSDADEQNEVMVASDEDWNGILLYPDGAPRYRVIYTNGGSATNHGTSLGEEGRDRVRDFVDGGGSYTGSCAGAFLSMLHYDIDDYEANGAWEPYYHLWPGVGDATYTGGEYHDIVFDDPHHPMIAGWPSLADGLVEDVYHNYGCRFDPDDPDNPPDTEYLGINDDPYAPALDGWHNMLAYKADEEAGRVVVTCSHPEGADSGEKLDLTAAILQYALDGQGEPWPEKGVIDEGVPVEMSRDHELLGDGQYHHWTVDLPELVESAELAVTDLSADTEIYVRLGDRPDRMDPLSASAPGADSVGLVLTDPEPGTWYLAVYGAHEVLNGSSYTVSAHWTVFEDTGLDDTSGDDPSPDYRSASRRACGCDAGSTPLGWLSLLVAGALLRRRRGAAGPARSSNSVEEGVQG